MLKAIGQKRNTLKEISFPMPSILIFCKTLVKGGAEKQAMITAKLLAQQGMSVSILIWDGSSMDKANLQFLENQQISCVGLRGSLFNKFADFINHLRQQNVTLILSYLSLANFLGALAGTCNKNIITVGGIRSERLPYFKFIIERFVHNRLNNRTIFNSYAARDHFERRGFNSGKSVVIHNAVTTNRNSNVVRNDDEIALISVSRFIESKDYPTALKAFRYLVDKYPEKKIKFLIVGYGKCETSIRLLIKKYGLESNVQMIIDPPNINELLACSDIYLSTSLVEGLSNSIMEAMAAGLPVVATDVGDNKFLIEDSKNGYIVPCRNSDVIARKLEHLILFNDIRKRFGEYSYWKICNEFTEKHMLKKYMEFIDELG
jgi:glycosyltransferase involved in cell wall biosynthesis